MEKSTEDQERGGLRMGRGGGDLMGQWKAQCHEEITRTRSQAVRNVTVTAPGTDRHAGCSLASSDEVPHLWDERHPASVFNTKHSIG